MSMFDLATNVMKHVKEATTSGAIAYLPSGFVHVQKALQTLAMMKRKWNISVLEKSLEGRYVVAFEKALSIEVEMKDWHEFNMNVLRRTSIDNGFMVDLGSYLIEKKEDELKTLFNELRGLLYSQLVTSPMKEVVGNLDAFQQIFKQVGVIRVEDAVLQYETFDSDVEILVKKLQVVYGDDRGGVEMIIEALKAHRPLNGFEVFDRSAYLLVGKYGLVYEGIKVEIDARVSMSWVPEEYMLVSDEEVLDVMDNYSGVAVSKNMLFPRNKVFSDKIFKMVKDEIDTVAGKEEK